MAVRELTAPASSRSRKPKYPFTEKEVKEAVTMLKAGKTPGVGPYEGETALREARSAAQSLVRHVGIAEPDLDVGTKAWEDESGDAYAILRVR
jgi:hypothetical protein